MTVRKVADGNIPPPVSAPPNPGDLLSAILYFTVFAAKVVDKLSNGRVGYGAVTDGTDQLRYIAGEDARQLIESRKAHDDATFIGGLKSQMQL